MRKLDGEPRPSAGGKIGAAEKKAFVERAVAAMKDSPGEWLEIMAWQSPGGASGWLNHTKRERFYGVSTKDCVFHSSSDAESSRVIGAYKPGGQS